MDEIKTKTLSWQNKTGRFNPEAYSWSFFCCLIMRIFLAGMGFMVWNSGLTQHLPDDPSIFHVAGEPVRNGLDQVLTGVWLRWDANQYTSIARSGYSLEKLTAFFPGYPLLGRLIAFVTHGDLLSILLAISFISTVGAGVTLYQIVERHYSVSTARMCVIGLLLFPSSFYYFAPYPMSLGLWVGLSAFQAGEKN